MTFAQYDPNIPNPPDDPADDVTQMQTNSASINSLIAIDHTGFNNPKGGTHKQVTFTENISAPGFAPGVADLFANVGPSDSWPFWQNAVGSFQLLSPVTASSTNGSTTLPGGIILKWGSFTATNTSSHTVTFATQFPTNLYNVQLTVSVSDNTTIRYVIDSTATFDKTQFTTDYSNSSKLIKVYWFAIGN